MIPLFLDIDGVLCPDKDTGDRDDPVTFLRETHVIAVGQFVTLFGLHVVISSTWREYLSAAKIQECLRAKGFGNDVFDTTPILKFNYDGWGSGTRQEPRGVEIGLWLIQHPEVTNLVILDDLQESEFYPLGRHLVKVNPHLGVGLNHLRYAAKVLKRPLDRDGLRKKLGR